MRRGFTAGLLRHVTRTRLAYELNVIAHAGPGEKLNEAFDAFGESLAEFIEVLDEAERKVVLAEVREIAKVIEARIAFAKQATKGDAGRKR